MSALTRLLFRYPGEPMTTPTVIRWWESRRPAFNYAVGAAGLVTVGAIELFSLLPPHAHPLGLGELVPGVVAYGVLANVCYTGGWITELGLRRLLHDGRSSDDLAPVGATVFRYGLVFSVGLTLFPIVFAALGWLARLARLVF